MLCAKPARELAIDRVVRVVVRVVGARLSAASASLSRER